MMRVPSMLCKLHRVPECPQCMGKTMSGKCEHGLTTRECMVCASPKRGAPQTGDEGTPHPRVMPHCSHCGFPLPANRSGLRHYGTHTAHKENECLRLLQAEIASLKDAAHSARADEAHRWASRVDGLTAQLREVDARYMALLKAVADGVAMQPRTIVLGSAPHAQEVSLLQAISPSLPHPPA